MQRLFQKRTVLGLDLGSGAIKAVERAKSSVRACGIERVTEGARGGAHAITAAVREVLRDGAFEAAHAVVGLNAGEVLMHQFRLPADLPPDEVEEQARLQAAKAAPYAVSEACYDFRREGRVDQQASYRMGIARSAVVEALARHVEEAGMKVAAVDLTSFAVQRALADTSRRHGAWAVLDGGHGATRLCVYAEDQLAFQHSQPFGCRQLAERLRLALGLTPAETPEAVAECRIPGGAVAPMREAFNRDLARHAERAFQLYLSSSRDAPAPEAVYFWGGSALVHGACNALEKALGAPVEVAGPTRRPADSAAPDYSPTLLGAWALALNDHA